MYNNVLRENFGFLQSLTKDVRKFTCKLYWFEPRNTMVEIDQNPTIKIETFEHPLWREHLHIPPSWPGPRNGDWLHWYQWLSWWGVSWFGRIARHDTPPSKGGHWGLVRNPELSFPLNGNVKLHSRDRTMCAQHEIDLEIQSDLLSLSAFVAKRKKWWWKIEGKCHTGVPWMHEKIVTKSGIYIQQSQRGGFTCHAHMALNRGWLILKLINEYIYIYIYILSILVLV